MLIELAPLLSALLLWAAFPPLGWAPLVFVALSPLLVALRRVRTRRGAALLGYIFGVAYFGLLMWWVKHTGFVAVTALVLGVSLCPALYGLGMWYARKLNAWRWWVVAVGGWALMEFMLGRWPLGGLSWGQLGYPVGDLSWPRGATQYIGTSGWGVMAVAVAAGLALAAGDRSRPLRWLVWPVTAVLALSVLGGVTAPAGEAADLTVAVVQGNSPCPGSGCAGESAEIYASHLALTRRLPAGGIDLVVWPESAIGSAFEPVTHPDRAEELAAEARRLDAYLLVGASRTLNAEEWVNVNILIDPDGNIVGEYAKRHPVPFGEFVPFRDQLDFIPDLEQVPRDLVRGEGPVVFDVDGGPLGSVISFEGAFARDVRSEISAGAGLIVVASNEASYGVSPAADQFIGMTRMRAAEFGVDVVHAAITGRSTIIRAGGQVGETTELFEADTVIGAVGYRAAGLTLYARLGDWVQFLAIMAMLAVVAERIIVARRRQEEVLTEVSA